MLKTCNDHTLFELCLAKKEVEEEEEEEEDDERRKKMNKSNLSVGLALEYIV